MDRDRERNEGERRKQDVLQTLAACREIYVNRGRRALLECLLRHGRASADDVRCAVELPGKIDPRCFGSVPGPLARAGIIQLVGYEKSDRRERHASIIAVWELLDEFAARDWLARHPDQVVPPIPPTNGAGQALAMPGLFSE